ncbi:MAG: hypothetical protein GC147_02475 [Porphyrobacter sp.]|nr:hypothetical protein [Porphyrobacter sp.]
MIVRLQWLALPVMLAWLAPPLAAEPATPPALPTLGEWIASDQAAGRLAPSPERTAALEALHRDVVAALQAARAAEEAQTASGRQTGTCLPPPGAVELASDEIGTWLYTRPQGEFGEPLEQVMRRFLTHRFPCR